MCEDFRCLDFVLAGHDKGILTVTQKLGVSYRAIGLRVKKKHRI